MKQGKNSADIAEVNYRRNMYCKNCGKKTEETSKFCRNCGEALSANEKSLATKHCPFCKTEIGIDYSECPSCKRILAEKIPSNVNNEFTTNTPGFNLQDKKSFVSKFITLIKRIKLPKFIFGQVFWILLGVILFIRLVSLRGDSSYSGGTRAPLPAPIEQVSNNDVIEQTPITPVVSLSNGKVLKKSSVYFQGYGELQIKNGTGLDAIAKLIRGGTSVFTVYIKANSNYTISNISDGVYWLAFAQGVDWDSVTQKFKRNTLYSAFDDTFDFTTTEDSQHYHYTTFEVTLNPVVGGTAQTSSVDPTQFNAY